LPRKSSSKIIIVGLGEIGRKLRGLLAVDNRFSVIPCNRTISPEDQDKILPLSDLSQRIPEADALVVCTGAPDAIILPEQISRRKSRQQLLILDLGIPEQVGPVPAGRKDLLRLGLDQLLCNPGGEQFNQATIGPVEKLVEEALQIFVDYYVKREFAGLLRQVQSGRQKYLSELIPRFVREFQPSLSAQQLSRMEAQLKGLISAYTHTVFNSIKAASRERSPRGSEKT
jgi:glutamyl-tRNA reductase